MRHVYKTAGYVIALTTCCLAFPIARDLSERPLSQHVWHCLMQAQRSAVELTTTAVISQAAKTSTTCAKPERKESTYVT